MAGHIHCGDVHDLTPGPWMAVGCCGCYNRRKGTKEMKVSWVQSSGWDGEIMGTLIQIAPISEMAHL